jgi:hypothetical protein
VTDQSPLKGSRPAIASGGCSPSMMELEAAVGAGGGDSRAPRGAAGSSAAAGGPAAGSSAVSRSSAWLDAHDPIVSPGRINLASKVKAARVYNNTSAAAAAAGGDQGGASPTGGAAST